MASAGQDDEEAITGINVTPFVDVMLVLLVVFMVTATYIVRSSIQIDLPKASKGDDQRQSVNLAFVLDRESKLYLDGRPLDYEGIPQEIQQVKEKNGSKLQALISADKATPHGSVIKLIDVIRENGITEFAIDIEQEAK